MEYDQGLCYSKGRCRPPRTIIENEPRAEVSRMLHLRCQRVPTSISLTGTIRDQRPGGPAAMLGVIAVL